MFKTGLYIIMALSIAGLIAGFSFGSGIGAPMPPEVAVNHETRQCANVMRGDECVICTLPDGWEILGRAPEAQCPMGYEEINIKLECKGIRELRCCLPGHSGGQGDCAGFALEGFLYCSPCLVLLLALVGLAAWLVRRKRKKHLMKDSEGNEPQ